MFLCVFMVSGSSFLEHNWRQCKRQYWSISQQSKKKKKKRIQKKDRGKDKRKKKKRKKGRRISSLRRSALLHLVSPELNGTDSTRTTNLEVFGSFSECGCIEEVVVNQGCLVVSGAIHGMSSIIIIITKEKEYKEE